MVLLIRKHILIITPMKEDTVTIIKRSVAKYLRLTLDIKSNNGTHLEDRVCKNTATRKAQLSRLIANVYILRLTVWRFLMWNTNSILLYGGRAM